MVNNSGSKDKIPDLFNQQDKEKMLKFIDLLCRCKTIVTKLLEDTFTLLVIESNEMCTILIF